MRLFFSKRAGALQGQPLHKDGPLPWGGLGHLKLQVIEREEKWTI